MAPATSPRAGLVADGLAIHHMPGHHIRRLQQVATNLFAKELAALDITPPQYAALVALAGAGPLVQSELAELIGCDRATTGGVVDRLEAKGWAVREQDPADRRVRRLSLSAAGAAALARATPGVEAVQAALVAPLSAAERVDFARLCRKILAHHQG